MVILSVKRGRPSTHGDISFSIEVLDDELPRNFHTLHIGEYNDRAEAIIENDRGVNIVILIFELIVNKLSRHSIVNKQAKHSKSQVKQSKLKVKKIAII